MNQAGIPMQIDFRDVYASVLKDWFVVDPAEIQTLFEHTVTFYPMIGACNLGLDEKEMDKTNLLVYPNPTYTQTTLRMETQNEWVKVEVYSIQGKLIQVSYDGNLDAKEHNIPIDTRDWAEGQYIIKVQKQSGNADVKLTKVK